MVWGWLKRRRRRRMLDGPAPEAWTEIVADSLWQYAKLTEPARQSLMESVRILVAERHFEGCAGFIVSEDTKVVIAAQMALMTLGLDDLFFEHVTSILIYPESFTMPHETPVGSGLAITEERQLAGEAWSRGPVLLSWPEVVAGGRSFNDGHQLVVHEFAHQLDMLGGRDVDGTPPMETRDQLEQWNEVTKKHFSQLQRNCRRGGQPLLNCYGATSAAEFFAVASETFFQAPNFLAHYAPDLRDVLARFYRQTPPNADLPPFF